HGHPRSRILGRATRGDPHGRECHAAPSNRAWTWRGSHVIVHPRDLARRRLFRGPSSTITFGIHNRPFCDGHHSGRGSPLSGLLALEDSNFTTLRSGFRSAL